MACRPSKPEPSSVWSLQRCLRLLICISKVDVIKHKTESVDFIQIESPGTLDKHKHMTGLQEFTSLGSIQLLTKAFLTGITCKNARICLHRHACGLQHCWIHSHRCSQGFTRKPWARNYLCPHLRCRADQLSGHLPCAHSVAYGEVLCLGSGASHTRWSVHAQLRSCTFCSINNAWCSL